VSRWLSVRAGAYVDLVAERSEPRILITHPERGYFSGRGGTKGDLAADCLRVEEPRMRAIGGRPVLLQRFPEGAGGPSFFQKRVPKSIPPWLQTRSEER